jgi:hypothetical protein
MTLSGLVDTVITIEIICYSQPGEKLRKGLENKNPKYRTNPFSFDLFLLSL